MKNKSLLICVLVLLMMLFNSCGTKGTKEPTTDLHRFPVVPDSIIVGVKGDTIELLPESEAFNKIVSSINERANKSDNFGVLMLATRNPESGEHLSYELRQSETFVEFIYNECKPQSFNMIQSGGGTKTEEMELQRLFFALSGQYHNCIFIGEDEEYKKGTTIGSLVDKTDLITYVRDLVAQEIVSE